MKSTDFASKDMYGESSRNRKVAEMVTNMLRNSVVNTDKNMVRVPSRGSRMFDTQHMNQFVSQSHFGGVATVSTMRSKNLLNEYSKLKNH